MIASELLMTAADAVTEAETIAEDAAAAAGTLTVAEHPSIIFPHLGINIWDLSNGFDVFGIHIAWYGVIIAVGMILAACLVYGLARRTGQNADDYIDLFIATVIFGIIGARIYYVLFSWSFYSANPKEIINLRNGGLAIYGGIILGFITVVVVCRIKKMHLLRVIDTCVPGVVIAQAIGRWGNFFNREAYGGYTDNFLAMQIKYTEANGVVNEELLTHLANYDGVKYIQVHPTFLYESLWCLLVFILIMIFRKKARYYGEVALWYFGGYALGRVFIESLRTDSLMIGNSNIAVSQLLALLILVGSLAVLIIMRVFISKEPESYPYVHRTVPGWQDLKFDKKKKAEEAAGGQETAQEESDAEQDEAAAEFEAMPEEAGELPAASETAQAEETSAECVPADQETAEPSGQSET